MKKLNKPVGFREGFSTGTAAAAAAKSAMYELLGHPSPETVSIQLPLGGEIKIRIEEHFSQDSIGIGIVQKDAGDDPDVTNKALIGARVRFLSPEDSGEIILTGGEGVGTVTKPGLPVGMNEPAINPTPRQMIIAAVNEVLQKLNFISSPGVEVEIFVPEGEKLASMTMNPRLGILGGISILGTTGLVKPFSHEAYTGTIESELNIALALGLKSLVLTTGGKSEAYAKKIRPDLPGEAFILMADYLGFSLETAVKMGFTDVTVVAFFGKALKMAQGFRYTHAKEGNIDFAQLSESISSQTKNQDTAGEVAQANTGRHVLEILQEKKETAVIRLIGVMMLQNLRRIAGQKTTLEAIILNFNGEVLCRDTEEGVEV